MGKTENIIQTRITQFLFILLLFALPSTVTAKEKNGENEVDHLALAALLIRDGFYERAEAALMSVDEQELKNKAQKLKNNEELIRFYTFSGLVALKKQSFSTASVHFEKAVTAGSTEIVVKVYLAQAYYGDRQFKKAVEVIEKNIAILNEYPALYGIFAQSLWNIDKKEQAYSVIAQARRKMPDDKQFLRQELFFLIGFKLYSTALLRADEFMLKHSMDENDFLTIGRALRKSGEYKKALHFLEKGALTYPESRNIRLELSGCYHDSGSLLTSAAILETVSVSDETLAAQTAELYRRAKRFLKSLFLNMSIDDQKEKLKQRLAYFIEVEEFESVVAMYSDASRAGLLENEDIIYAFAYSNFMTGNYPRTENLLSRITRNDLFKKAAELRKSMEIHLKESSSH